MITVHVGGDVEQLIDNSVGLISFNQRCSDVRDRREFTNNHHHASFSVRAGYEITVYFNDTFRYHLYYDTINVTCCYEFVGNGLVIHAGIIS